MRTGRLDGLSIAIVGGTSGMGLSAAIACQREGAVVTVGGRADEHAAAAGDRLGSTVAILTGDATAPAFASAVLDEAVRNH